MQVGTVEYLNGPTCATITERRETGVSTEPKCKITSTAMKAEANIRQNYEKKGTNDQEAWVSTSRQSMSVPKGKPKAN